MILDNLKLITNYKETKLVSTSHTLSYVDIISNDDDEYLKELKTKRRDIFIDVLLGEKENSELEDLKLHDKWEGGNNNFIAPSVYTLTAKCRRISSYKDILEDLLLFLDKETNSKKTTSGSLPNLNTNLDLIFKKDVNLTDNENIESFIRKIKTKITMSSNIIAMDGRIGMGTFALVGKNNWTYFRLIEDKNTNPSLISVNGMTIIYTDKIDDDKVIIGRKNNSDQSGISLSIDLENQKYIRFETNFWKKQYCWFKIK